MKCSALVSSVETTLLSGGFIDLSVTAAIVPMTQALPAVFGAMLQLTSVQTKITDFLTSIYGTDPIPEADTSNFYYFKAPVGYKIAFVNICGRATPLILPISAITVSSSAGDAGSCACDKGSCTYSVTTFGGVKHCTGNCTGTCTLKLKLTGDDLSSVVGTPGGTYFSAVSYLF